MLMEIILAASLQSGQPLVAACAVTPNGVSRNRSVPRSLSVECPGDVRNAAALQARAEAAIDRIPLNLNRRIHLQFINQVWFQYFADAGWQPLPRQIVIAAVSAPEDSVVQALYTRQDCAFAAFPDPDGVPEDISVTCLLNGEDTSRLIPAAERATRRTVENSRFLPVPERYCWQNEYRVVLSAPGFRVEMPQERVDLPDLCEGQESVKR